MALPRTRNHRAPRPDLSSSWVDADVREEEDDEWEPEEEDYGEDEQGGRHGRKRDMRTSRLDASNETPRKRATRSSAGPELVMPSMSSSGLNGHTKGRDATPRFRLNERSMTAGPPKASPASVTQRTATPRFRMNARSMTSDAGRYARHDGADEEGEDGSLAGYAHMARNRILAPTLAYLVEIVGLVLGNAKPLIAYILFAYLIGAALVFGSGFLTNSINNALSPLCRIPGVTTFFSPPFCAHSSSTSGSLEGPAEFDKLVQAQSQFEDVLAASSTGANLPLDMKRSEAGIRDLKHVVQYSTLPSRNELVYEFDGFISTARQASSDLSKFNSRIGRAVDHILSTNRWTIGVIDGIREEEGGKGSVAKFFNTHLNIFAPFQPVSLSRDMLLDQYLRHTGAVEEQIVTLISEAQALLGILDNLDGRLEVIADISMRDGLKAQDNKDELFAYLWTKLGGNRSSVKKLENQLQLLRDVGNYKRIAWAHVTTTIVKLQAIRDNLEDLRERVALPETLGTDQVPLEVHIDAINLGIERLEEQRDVNRKLEAENYQRVLEKAREGEGRMIGGKEL